MATPLSLSGCLIEILTTIAVSKANTTFIVNIWSHPTTEQAHADQHKVSRIAGDIYASDDSFEAHRRVLDALPEVSRIQTANLIGDGVVITRCAS